ncbi:hypothetical protein RIF29_40689 [Crotalaria pallida]|uniref:Uncharacterized protein n=1 Tax=Crotalaria pallida TaxID=3830 RepID=A0AAN9HRX0_CROPI
MSREQFYCLGLPAQGARRSPFGQVPSSLLKLLATTESENNRWRMHANGNGALGDEVADVNETGSCGNEAEGVDLNEDSKFIKDLIKYRMPFLYACIALCVDVRRPKVVLVGAEHALHLKSADEIVVFNL